MDVKELNYPEKCFSVNISGGIFACAYIPLLGTVKDAILVSRHHIAQLVKVCDQKLVVGIGHYAVVFLEKILVTYFLTDDLYDLGKASTDVFFMKA